MNDSLGERIQIKELQEITTFDSIYNYFLTFVYKKHISSISYKQFTKLEERSRQLKKLIE